MLPGVARHIALSVGDVARAGRARAGVSGRGEAVARNIECRQVSKISKRREQPRKLVASEVQLFQVSESIEGIMFVEREGVVGEY